MRTPRRVLTIAASVAIGCLAGAGVTVVAAAATAPSATTYYGCLGVAGTLYRVGTTESRCFRGAKPISWNAQGPQGPTGPQGATGATGATGPQGPQGPAGVFHDCSAVPGPDTAPGSDFAECDFLADTTPSTEEDVDLTGDDLSEANLTGFAWQTSEFVGADLTGAQLGGDTLEGTSLVGDVPRGCGPPELGRGTVRLHPGPM